MANVLILAGTGWLGREPRSVPEQVENCGQVNETLALLDEPA